MKSCKTCHVKKPERAFTKPHAVCKQCRSAKQNEINKQERKQANLADKNEIEKFLNEILIKYPNHFFTREEFEIHKKVYSNATFTNVNSKLFKKEIKKGFIIDAYRKEVNIIEIEWVFVYDPEVYKGLW